MFAFVAPAVTGFGQAVSGTALCRAPVVARSAVSMKLSPAMPFMNQPAALDDATIPGNSGFDPFSFSETFDLKVCIVPSVGFGTLESRSYDVTLTLLPAFSFL